MSENKSDVLEHVLVDSEPESSQEVFFSIGASYYEDEVTREEQSVNPSGT